VDCSVLLAGIVAFAFFLLQKLPVSLATVAFGGIGMPSAPSIAAVAFFSLGWCPRGAAVTARVH
jgi:hypothetical protein